MASKTDPKPIELVKELETVAEDYRKQIQKRWRYKLSRCRVQLLAAGRQYVCEYEPADGKRLAIIRVNTDVLRLNPRDRIHLSIGHEMVHHYIAESGTDAAVHGHGQAFKDVARSMVIPVRGRYASIGPVKKPPSKTTLYKWVCECPKGYAVRARSIEAKCVHCGKLYRRADVGEVAEVPAHSLEPKMTVTHRRRGWTGTVVSVTDEHAVIRLKSGKSAKYYAADWQSNA